MIEHKHTSKGWDHDRGHFRFHRVTPTAQRHIPFARERRQHKIASVVGAGILLALFLILAYAPVWVHYLP